MGSQNSIQNLIFEPLHYIMERRMFLGIKSVAERHDNSRLSTMYDILWFLGIILSALGIVILIFKSKNILEVLLCTIFSTLWFYSLLIFDPLFISSTILSLFVFITLKVFSRSNPNQQSRCREYGYSFLK